MQRITLLAKEALLRYGLQTRYTQSVTNALKLLREKGYEVVQLNNFWQSEEDAYSGVDVVLRKNGKLVEIQFHTPQSYDTKENSFDALFEQFRDETDAEKMKQLHEQMIQLWRGVPTPPGADNLKV